MVSLDKKRLEQEIKAAAELEKTYIDGAEVQRVVKEAFTAELKKIQ